MRTIKCTEIHGTSVDEALNGFNEKRRELGVKKSDLISVSVRPAPDSPKQSVVVAFFYWSK